MAKAVISRPGPLEPEKGLPGPDEDNRSAEKGQSVTNPNEVNQSQALNVSVGCDPKRSLTIRCQRQ